METDPEYNEKDVVVFTPQEPEIFMKKQEKRLQKIVNMKFKGMSDETISKELDIAPQHVNMLYNQFVRTSMKDLSARKPIIALQSQVYKKRLAEAEENYEKAKQMAEDNPKANQIAVAAWHKIVVETADSYTNFLTKIGAISVDTYKEFALEPEIKAERSPLEILIEANRKKLMEEIQKAKEEEQKENQNGPVSTESSNNAP